jgi:ribonuclease P protein component
MAVERLKNRTDFLRVSRARRRSVAGGLIVETAPRPTDPAKSVAADEAPPFRVGFTTSRKVGNAVERNRARRRLRAAVEQVMPLHARRGQDYVIIARRTTLTRPFDKLIRDLESALIQLGSYVNGHDPRSGEPVLGVAHRTA